MIDLVCFIVLLIVAFYIGLGILVAIGYILSEIESKYEDLCSAISEYFKKKRVTKL
jgi:hypothetical protein